jgi:hypothetical protein
MKKLLLIVTLIAFLTGCSAEVRVKSVPTNIVTNAYERNKLFTVLGAIPEIPTNTVTITYERVDTKVYIPARGPNLHITIIEGHKYITTSSPSGAIIHAESCDCKK